MKELTLGTILNAFREITDDSVTDSDARIMAQALGALPVDALLHLTSEAGRQMINLAEGAVARTTACVSEALAKDRGSVTVASIPAPSRPRPHGLIRVAAALQALVLAVSPPDNNDPLFVARGPR